MFIRFLRALVCCAYVSVRLVLTHGWLFVSVMGYLNKVMLFFRVMEHSYASARAIEERGRRPNYRPVLEHDGLLTYRVLSQVKLSIV